MSKAAHNFSCTQSSSRLNVGDVVVNNSGEFAPTTFWRYPRCDVTNSMHIFILVGKVYIPPLLVPPSAAFHTLAGQCLICLMELLQLLNCQVRWMFLGLNGVFPPFNALLPTGLSHPLFRCHKQLLCKIHS